VKPIPPRAGGALLLCAAVGLIVLNVNLAAHDQRFFPAIYPAAGFITPMGVLMLVTGYNRDDMAHGRAPRALVLAVVVAMLIGVYVGLEMNLSEFGRRL